MDFDLDEKRLNAADSNDKRELMLFQWLSAVIRDLPATPKEIIAANQSKLESALKKFITSANPKPGKTLRDLLARALVLVYEHGETRTLIDTISFLQTFLTNKKLDDFILKTSALSALGRLTETHGMKIVSLFPESLNIFLKAYKNAKEIHLSLRMEALIAISLAVKGCGKLFTEQMIKDCLKLAKSGLQDKNSYIQVESAKLLGVLHSHSPLQSPSKPEEYDSIAAQLFRMTENSNTTTRKTVAQVTAMILSTAVLPPTEIKNELKKQSKSAPVAEKDEHQHNMLDLPEALTIISGQIIKSSSKEGRITGFDCFLLFFRYLGMSNVETNFPVILDSILRLCSEEKLTSEWADVTFIRSCVNHLLHETGKLLSENGQLKALEELINILKKYHTASSDQKPHHLVLTAALSQIANFIVDLGSAVTPLKDQLYESLIMLQPHPSGSVNLSLSWTIKAFCITVPSISVSIIDKILKSMQKESKILSADDTDSIRRFLKTCNIIVAVISSIAYNPLYVPYEYSARVLGFALQLVKQDSSNIDSRVYCAQTEVAWMLIAALMTIGPNFVRTHTSQLFLIWKNMFSKLTTKESLSSKSDEEIYQMIVCKEAALKAILSFIENNSDKLMTPDMAKRFAVFLNNAGSFVSSLPDSYKSPIVSSKILDRELLLKKRLFQCCVKLSPKSSFESSHINLLTMATDVFGINFEKTIAKFIIPGNDKDKGFISSSTLETEYVTSSIEGYRIATCKNLNLEDKSIGRWEDEIVGLDLLLNPGCISCYENDIYFLIENPSDKNKDHVAALLSKPLVVELIDSAVDLYAALFPLQSPGYQEASLESLSKSIKTLRESKELKLADSRKLYIQLNILTAIHGSLKHMATNNGTWNSAKAPTIIRSISEYLINAPEHHLRNIAADILGRLCQVSYTPSFANGVLQGTIDSIVKNREFESRSGNCLALGCIIGYLGGLAATNLKNIVGILHTLVTDSHPLVHTWALYALCLVVENSSLMYGPYVNSTLSILTKILFSEPHEKYSSQIRAGMNNEQILAGTGKLLYYLLGVLGPEILASSDVRELCFNTYDFLKTDPDYKVVIEAIKCVQHLNLFAPQYVPIKQLVPFLQLQIKNDQEFNLPQIRKASVTCLYQITQRNPESVLDSVINNQLEEQLLALLDSETNDLVLEGIRDIITSLLKHVSVKKPSRWINLCRIILQSNNVNSHAQGGQQEQASGDRSDDEEDAPARSEKPRRTSKIFSKNEQFNIVLNPRWRTQVFVVNCVRRVLDVVQSSGEITHFDLSKARAQKQTDASVDYLIFHLNALISISFNSATAEIKELNIEGIHLLQDLFLKYASVADPDIDGHSILSQYQAQLNAALTPCLGKDVHLEVKSVACQVVSTYITSAVAENVHGLSRVMKALSAALNEIKDHESEDAETSNDSVSQLFTTFKIGVLAAWANLFVSSQNNAELLAIVNNKIDFLYSLWISLLDLYCRLISEMVEKDMKVNLKMERQKTAYFDGILMATSDILIDAMKSNWVLFMHASVLAMQNSSIHLEEQQKLENSLLLTGLCMDELSKKRVFHSRSLVIKLLCQTCSLLVTTNLEKSLPIASEILSQCEYLIMIEDTASRLQIIEMILQIPTNFESNSDNRESRRQFYEHLQACVSRLLVHYIPDLAMFPTLSLGSSETENVELLVKVLECCQHFVTNTADENSDLPFLLFIVTAILSDERHRKEISTAALNLLQKVVAVFAESSDPKIISLFSMMVNSISDGLLSQDSNDENSADLVKNRLLALIIVLKAIPVSLPDNIGDQLKSLVLGSNNQASLLAISCIQFLINHDKELSEEYLPTLYEKIEITLEEGASTNDAVQALSNTLNLIKETLSSLSNEVKVALLFALVSMFTKQRRDTKSSAIRVASQFLLVLAQKYSSEMKFVVSNLSVFQKSAVETMMRNAFNV